MRSQPRYGDKVYITRGVYRGYSGTIEDEGIMWLDWQIKVIYGEGSYDWTYKTMPRYYFSLEGEPIKASFWQRVCDYMMDPQPLKDERVF